MMHENTKIVGICWPYKTLFKKAVINGVENIKKVINVIEYFLTRAAYNGCAKIL